MKPYTHKHTDTQTHTHTHTYTYTLITDLQDATCCPGLAELTLANCSCSASLSVQELSDPGLLPSPLCVCVCVYVMYVRI